MYIMKWHTLLCVIPKYWGIVSNFISWSINIHVAQVQSQYHNRGLQLQASRLRSSNSCSQGHVHKDWWVATIDIVGNVWHTTLRYQLGMQSQAGRVQINALRMFLLLSTLNYINIALQGFTYVYTVVWHQYPTQNYKVRMIPCASEKNVKKHCRNLVDMHCLTTVIFT